MNKDDNNTLQQNKYQKHNDLHLNDSMQYDKHTSEDGTRKSAVEKICWSKGQEDRSQMSLGCENKPWHTSSVAVAESLIKCTYKKRRSTLAWIEQKSHNKIEPHFLVWGRVTKLVWSRWSSMHLTPAPTQSTSNQFRNP